MIYHGNEGLDDIASNVEAAVKRLRRHKPKFDILVVTGMSGALVGSPVAINLEVPLIVVRKPSDDAHQYGDIIGQLPGADARYLFLDDFISMGSTYRRIRSRMGKLEPTPRYAGAYLYASDVLSWAGDGKIHEDFDNDFCPAKVIKPFSFKAAA